MFTSITLGEVHKDHQTLHSSIKEQIFLAKYIHGPLNLPDIFI